MADNNNGSSYNQKSDGEKADAETLKIYNQLTGDGLVSTETKKSK